MSGDDGIERESNFLNVISGDRDNEYFALANWNEVPVEPEKIHGCVVRINSNDDSFEWSVIFEMKEWFFVLKRINSHSYVIGTAADYLVRVSGVQSEIIQTGLAGGILDIWVIDDNNWWLAYDSGLAHYNGSVVTPSWIGERIHKIYNLSPDFAVAVGASGCVVVFDGISWREVESSPTNQQLIGVFCASKNQVFISGWNGVLYEWDGKSTWKKIKFTGVASASDINADSIVRYLDDVYVCANDAGIFRINGKKAELAQKFYASRAVIINDKLIATGGNLFVEYDGENWSQAEIDLPA